MKNLIPLPIRKCLGGIWHTHQEKSSKRKLLSALSGRGTVCNVCGWEGSRFTDDCWHPGTICPDCGSQVRHRLLVAALDGKSDLSRVSEKELLLQKSVLHFAPERQLRNRIQNAAAKYMSADFDRGDCDLRLDISKMPEVSDSTIDTLIVCDVLEHVPDDHAAFQEIHRVLKAGGTAILSVPQKDSPASTEEDATVSSDAEREKRFGQKDHVRMYGDDFLERLKSAGFEVHILTEKSVPAAMVTSHVLHPPILNSNPLATNQRRIYFAKKL